MISVKRLYLPSASRLVRPPRRIVYLGLTLGLRTLSFLLCISGFALLKRHLKREEKYALTNGSAELESLSKEENSSTQCEQLILTSERSHDRETRL